jgi:hypothetical protein
MSVRKLTRGGPVHYRSREYRSVWSLVAERGGDVKPVAVRTRIQGVLQIRAGGGGG